jgi:site-specific recombinase XerD
VAGASEFRESTKHGYRQALTEVLAFLGDPEARPGEVTRTAALSYIEQSLTRRGFAYNTTSDCLAALTSFWGYLASRGVVTREGNPWTDHRISKKRHK